MVHPHQAHRQRDDATTAASGLNDAARTVPVDPRTFGLAKAAYSVQEPLDVLSIGRTSLYAAAKRGELTPIKFRRKTLFLAGELAAFLARLSKLNNG